MIEEARQALEEVEAKLSAADQNSACLAVPILCPVLRPNAPHHALSCPLRRNGVVVESCWITSPWPVRLVRHPFILALLPWLSHRSVEQFHCLLLSARQDVAVCVQGEPHGGVTKSLTHDLRVGSALEQLRSVSVPQIAWQIEFELSL